MFRLRRPQVFGYIGRRGHSLLFFGLLYVIIGQSYYTTPPTPQGKEALWAHLNVMPLKAWGALWMISGLMSFIGGCYKRLQPIAFGIASGVMGAWAFGFAVNVILGHGYRTYVGFITYICFAAFILLIAGWPEERDYGE